MNVLIGANGSGKSNLISFFKMMNELAHERLQRYITETGRAHSILHFGPKVSNHLSATIEFSKLLSTQGACRYEMSLYPVAGDTLAFSKERIVQVSLQDGSDSRVIEFKPGLLESSMPECDFKDYPMMVQVDFDLRSWDVYHFHDTSATSRIRQFSYAYGETTLMKDAANIAAFLWQIKNSDSRCYRRIVETVRLIAPYFHDFSLTLTPQEDVILNWLHAKSDLIFGPHQLSDGTLRAICLIALLLQPTPHCPSLLIVDEPELGLHPYALGVIASLFRSKSESTQVIISTQSSAFLDHFEPEDVIVAEYRDGKSTFHRPGAEKLNAWLEEYSLGEIWEKNVIGGGPH